MSNSYRTLIAREAFGYDWKFVWTRALEAEQDRLAWKRYG